MGFFNQDKHEKAWDLYEQGKLEKAEEIFREVLASGEKSACLGIGFCVRDNPQNRKSSEFSSIALEALEFANSLNDQKTINAVIGNLYAPLGRYVIQAKSQEWAAQIQIDDSVELSDLEDSLNPWIANLLNILEFVSPAFSAGEVDSETTINYYENIRLISEMVNNEGRWRNRLMGDGPNLYLQKQAKTGIDKFGSWKTRS